MNINGVEKDDELEEFLPPLGPVESALNDGALHSPTTNEDDADTAINERIAAAGSEMDRLWIELSQLVRDFPALYGSNSNAECQLERSHAYFAKARNSFAQFVRASAKKEEVGKT